MKRHKQINLAEAGVLVAAGAAAGAWPDAAFACTLCYSPQAVSLRAQLFDGNLWWMGAAILLPIVLLLLIVAVVAREPRCRGGVE
jgi:hypothetical protein